MSSEQIPEGRAWIGITRSSALAWANEIAPQQNNIGIVVVYFPTEANIHNSFMDDNLARATFDLISN